MDNWLDFKKEMNTINIKLYKKTLNISRLFTIYNLCLGVVAYILYLKTHNNSLWAYFSGVSIFCSIYSFTQQMDSKDDLKMAKLWKEKLQEIEIQHEEIEIVKSYHRRMEYMKDIEITNSFNANVPENISLKSKSQSVEK